MLQLEYLYITVHIILLLVYAVHMYMTAYMYMYVCVQKLIMYKEAYAHVHVQVVLYQCTAVQTYISTQYMYIHEGSPVTHTECGHCVVGLCSRLLSSYVFRPNCLGRTSQHANREVICHLIPL